MLTEKTRLRAEYRRRRAALPVEEWARRGAAAEARLLETPALSRAETVYTYEAFGREVPTGRTVRTLLERGARVVIPPADRHADPLSEAQILRPGHRDSDLQAVAERIVPAFDVRRVDLFIVPGIVWDARGYRIGFGGGFFDRLLAAARPDALKIGLAFEQQMVVRVPNDAWDVPVDLIVTEAGIVPSAGELV